MNVGVETLFTAALGLQAPWWDSEVNLNKAKRPIDFTGTCGAPRLECLQFASPGQGVCDRADNKPCRQLNFFQFEAWPQAKVPSKCTSCGETTQLKVPWACSCSGFTLLFDALALCGHPLVNQAAGMLRVAAKRLWNRVEYDDLKVKQDKNEAHIVGIDETSVKKGREYITVRHDLDQKRLPFACAGRDHETVEVFAQERKDHGGEPAATEHACMGMSEGYIKTATVPRAQISYGRFHFIVFPNAGMDEIRHEEMHADAPAVNRALSKIDRKVLKGVMWGMVKNPMGWGGKQTTAMHRLQHADFCAARGLCGSSRLCVRSTRGWFTAAMQARPSSYSGYGCRGPGDADLRPPNGYRHQHGAPAGRLLCGRSNAYVEAMNGLLQQAKTAALGFRTVRNFIAIAYLRMAKLKDLPANPFAPADLFDLGGTRHVC